MISKEREIARLHFSLLAHGSYCSSRAEEATDKCCSNYEDPSAIPTDYVNIHLACDSIKTGLKKKEYLSCTTIHL